MAEAQLYCLAVPAVGLTLPLAFSIGLYQLLEYYGYYSLRDPFNSFNYWNADCLLWLAFMTGFQLGAAALAFFLLRHGLSRRIYPFAR